MSIGPVLVVIAVLEIATPVCGLARNDKLDRFSKARPYNISKIFSRNIEKSPTLWYKIMLKEY